MSISKKEMGNRILIDIRLENIVEAKNQLNCLSYYMEDDDNFNNSREVAELYHTIWDCCDDICRFYLDKK
jgi:hypothetical protein